MIVSHANRYIYMRNPKAASSSIGRALVDYDRYATDDFAKNPHGDIKSLIKRWPSRYDYVMKESRMEKWLGKGVLEDIFPPTFDSYTKVVTVRNPWSRFLSAYLYLQTGNGGVINDGYFQKYMYGAETFEKLLSRPFHPHLKCEIHCRDQLNYIRGSSGNVKAECNLILRIEDMDLIDTTFRQLTDNPNYKTYHINTCFRKKDPRFKKPYTDYYNDEMVEIVRDLYAEDIKFLGYEFGE